MSNPDQARRAIELLRNFGVKFTLIDLGCGYASIGAMRAFGFGFDRMKIDLERGSHVIGRRVINNG